MMEPRIGVVGLGGWGQNVARSFHEIPSCRLEVCSDISEERRQMAQRNWNVATCSNLDEMLRRFPNLDAIAIASPACTHYELAHKALLAGKDIFVEKPLTLNTREAEELRTLAARSGSLLMVGHLMLYHPAVNYMRELIRNGELGNVYYLYTQRVNLGRIRGDENALWSFAPHDLSQILYLLDGTPIDVSARGQSFIQDGIEDVVFLSLYFSNRIMAHVHISWLDPHKVRSTTVVGSKKMVVFDDAASSEKLRVYDNCARVPPPASYGEAIQVRFGDIQIPRIAATEPLKIELEHFLDCVVTRQQPRSGADEGLRIVRILDAAQKSLNMDGLPISLATGRPSLTAEPRSVLERRWTASMATPSIGRPN